MNLILFDVPTYRDSLKPVTLTRPVADIRCGILTLKEKWEKYLHLNASFLTEDYLTEKFPVEYTEDNLYVNSSASPFDSLASAVVLLNQEEALFYENDLIAFRTSSKLKFGADASDLKRIKFDEEVRFFKELPHLFLNNGKEIETDFKLLTITADSQKNEDPFTVIYNPDNVFIGKNVSIKAAIINAEAGPVYIGDNAVIQEGAILIGPVAVCDNAMVAFGAKIRSNTTLGPFCRVGGEVGNSVFHAYTNKAHDGFLGNSYLGAWCNLGANTNNSNLKNNYKPVSLYSYGLKELYNTGEVFCGTFMGDYTKAGISTMFNTGTVVGVSSNVYGSGFQDKFIPSFLWGGKSEGYLTYRFDKAIEVINATMNRKSLELSEADYQILKHISENP